MVTFTLTRSAPKPPDPLAPGMFPLPPEDRPAKQAAKPRSQKPQGTARQQTPPRSLRDMPACALDGVLASLPRGVAFASAFDQSALDAMLDAAQSTGARPPSRGQESLAGYRHAVVAWAQPAAPLAKGASRHVLPRSSSAGDLRRVAAHPRSPSHSSPSARSVMLKKLIGASAATGDGEDFMESRPLRMSDALRIVPGIGDSRLQGHARLATLSMITSRARKLGDPRLATAGCGGGRSGGVYAKPVAAVLCDKGLAEAYGRAFMGSETWAARVFRMGDGDDSMSQGYLLPAEFAMLTSRLSFGLGEAPVGKDGSQFSFRFNEADLDRDGRISAEEWEVYTYKMEHAFGIRRCKTAALCSLGLRRAEDRRTGDRVWVFRGYDDKPSLLLLRSCARPGSASLFETIKSCLQQKADPNCALTDPQFNGYTPLILLAMARVPAKDGPNVIKAIDLLIAAGADPHRECEDMTFGRWVPLRFAAQMQNQYGLEALLHHIDVGDRFSWAAGESIESVMLVELASKSSSALSERIAAECEFDSQATVLLQLFASDIVGGNLSPEGARRLCSGEWDSSSLQPNALADPNGVGLGGITALMDTIKKGDVETVKALLGCRATPRQEDSDGASPLHLAAATLQPAIAKLLIEARAELHAVDHAGFSPWMIVGEDCGDFVGYDEQHRMQELHDMLAPRFKVERMITAFENNDWIDTLLEGESEVDLEELPAKLRLHECLFYNDDIVRRGAFEGRQANEYLLRRISSVMIRLLKTDPLKGNDKVLAKYLLQATMGPSANEKCRHVRYEWKEHDNRKSYHVELDSAVQDMLYKFAGECNTMRADIVMDAAAEPSGACAALCKIDADRLVVPEALHMRDEFWREVVRNGVLRFDPTWARQVHDGVSCFTALYRLGTVKRLRDYCRLLQVDHASMREFLARGYITYSNLCNEPFQTRMKDIVARASSDAKPPKHLVGAKRLNRLMEKTQEAATERNGVQWPGYSAEYLHCSYCFYILDTVRISFTCEGETLADQVACCMRVLQELRSCTVEKDGLCVLREKSGFASGVSMSGGYADVKLLCFADLGHCRAADGSMMPLQIVGEVQLILGGYMKVKHRMHLAYEVGRGSFNRK